MALDPRIILGGQSTDLAQIDRAASRNRLADLKVQATERGMRDQNRLRSLLPQAFRGNEQARTQAAALNPDLMGTFQTADANRMEVEGARRQQIGRLATAVLQSRDPEAAYQRARQFAVERLGADPQNIPEQYDEGYLRNVIAVTQQAEGADYSRSITRAVDPEGNPVFVQPSAAGGVREVEGYRPPPQRRTMTDQFGNTFIVDLDSGRVVQAGGEPAPEQPTETQPEQPQGDVFGALEEGTGPISGVRSMANRVIGPFMEGTVSPETEAAKSAIRNFNQEAKTALVNNPRFPVAEQKIVQDLMPNADEFWTDPDAEREKLLQLRRFLASKMEQNEITINSGNVTKDEVGRLSNQNESIRRVLGMMGEPAPQEIPQMSLEQLNQLDMESLSAEELQQAAERYDQLQEGGNGD